MSSQRKFTILHMRYLVENVQNAYDAIRMREQYSGGKWSFQNDGLIKIDFDNEKIVISDNGIGMSETTIKENYWKAGLSGKRTDFATKSGVVGTFGIGAMANFGVWTKLRVETESLETKERIVSEVERRNLSLIENCINIEKVPPLGEYGTKIIVMLDPGQNKISPGQAQQYLSPYVQYLPVKVDLNGIKISQNQCEDKYKEKNVKFEKKWPQFQYCGIIADVKIQVNENARITATLNNLVMSGERVTGDIYLQQDSGPLWGFRSYFGLAPIPINSKYPFGGVVNLSIITPTAGREALSRESIELTQNLIQLAEICATKTLALTDLCNKNTPFMSHVISLNDLSLAGNLKIRIEPLEEMPLAILKDQSQKRNFNYYTGTEDSIIKQYGTPDAPLILLSRSNPRKQIESMYIERYCRTTLVKDSPTIFEIYPEKEYSLAEISFIIKTKNILEIDYALSNVRIQFAKISHNLPIKIDPPENGQINIFINRNHTSILPILRCYSEAYDVFYGIIKDYIRSYIYPRIKDWVPSSTREGADALLKILRQKRELYEIRSEDVEMTSIFSDLAAGKFSIEEVFVKAKTFTKTQSQEIKSQNIGKLENEIPDLRI